MKGCTTGFCKKEIFAAAKPAGQKELARNDKAFFKLPISIDGRDVDSYAALHTDKQPMCLIATTGSSAEAPTTERRRTYRSVSNGPFKIFGLGDTSHQNKVILGSLKFFGPWDSDFMKTLSSFKITFSGTDMAQTFFSDIRWVGVTCSVVLHYVILSWEQLTKTAGARASC